MTTPQRKLATDRRAAALSVIGQKRHIIVGHLVGLPSSNNLLLSDDMKDRRGKLRKILADINTEFLKVANLPLVGWLPQVEALKEAA